MKLDALNLTELNFEEKRDIDGGVPHALAVAAVCGAGLGVILVGCLVGYGIYRLVDWATR